MVEVESWVSCLHHRLTVMMMMAFCLLVTAVQYLGIGTKISCISDVRESVLDNYCFMNIFLTPVKPLDYNVGYDVPHPGVDKTMEPKVLKSYFHYVPLVLLLQAILFYTPHFLLMGADGGKISAIVYGLREDKKENGSHKELVEYLIKHRNTHNWWAIKMIFCNILMFFNPVVNICIINIFFGGEFDIVQFLTTGSKVQSDSISRILPTMARCTFHNFSPSGNIQKHDAHCLLPINDLNQHIFLFSWFWFAFLNSITPVVLIYHMVNIFCLHKIHLTRVYPGLGKVTSKFQVGDWWMLHLLSNNISPVLMGKVIEELMEKGTTQEDIQT